MTLKKQINKLERNYTLYTLYKNCTVGFLLQKKRSNIEDSRKPVTTKNGIIKLFKKAVNLGDDV